MPRSINSVKFELNKVYKTYADQLLISSEVAGLLHESVDIKASGNQVEASLRVLLSKLLPSEISVGHGHVIDKKFAVSKQQDIVITEGIASKSIMHTLDGTEFFMYESVYCIGEVKKTWSKDTLISTMNSVSDIRQRLERQPVLPNVFATTPDIITMPNALTEYPYRNPLLSFAFAIDFSKEVKYNSFSSILNDRNKWEDLPNIVIVLKQGIFIMIDEKQSAGDSVHIKLYPGFQRGNDKCKWYFLPNSDELGKNLAFLIFSIQQHIDDSVLERPSLLDYGSGLLNINRSELIEI